MRMILKKVFFQSIPFMLLMLLSGGCRPNGGVDFIVCDTDAAIRIELSDSSDFKNLFLISGPLKPPQHVEIPGDGNIYFHCADTVFCYSLADGSRMSVYGRRGRAKDEYIRVWEYWLDGEDLCLYDLDGHKILRYDRTGELLDILEMTDSEHPFQLLCRLDAEHLVGRMMYQGVRDATPELGIFGNDYVFSHIVGDRKLLSGIRTGYPFCRNEEGVLMCAPFSDRIYQISVDSCYLKYRIEFLDGTLKLENYSDEFALLGDIEDKLARRSFSYAVTGLREADGFLGFQYRSSKKGAMFALYDIGQKKTYCYNAIMPENWELCDAVLLDDRICFIGFNDDSGTCIWTVKKEILLSLGGDE